MEGGGPGVVVLKGVLVVVSSIVVVAEQGGGRGGVGRSTCMSGETDKESFLFCWDFLVSFGDARCRSYDDNTAGG